MINLLPPTAKTEIRSGRVNRLLVRYLALFAILMIVLFLELAGAYLFLSYSKSTADATTKSNLESSTQLTAKQAENTEFINNLGVAKQILSKQVNYSTVLLRIASVTPSNVIFDQLTLDASKFGRATTITAKAKTEYDALRFKDALSASPYFDNPHFQSLTRDTKTQSPYKYSITMDVTFTKELLK